MTNNNFALSIGISNNDAAEFNKAVAEKFANIMGEYAPDMVNEAIKECDLSISAIEKSEIERLLILAFNGQQAESEIYYSTGKDSELEVSLKKICIKYLNKYSKCIINTAANKVGISEMSEEERNFAANKLTETFAAAMA